MEQQLWADIAETEADKVDKAAKMATLMAYLGEMNVSLLVMKSMNLSV